MREGLLPYQRRQDYANDHEWDPVAKAGYADDAKWLATASEAREKAPQGFRSLGKNWIVVVYAVIFPVIRIPV